MKTTGKTIKKLLALILSAMLIAGTASAGVSAIADEIQSAGNAPLQISTISDIHYYPESLNGNRCSAYLDFINDNSREFDQSSALLDAALYALEMHKTENYLKYLLIPGDLSKDGEKEGHIELASKLEAFEEKTGVQVIVVNGNHDINNGSAVSFEGGTRHAAATTSPEDFREIYKNLGRDIAYHTYTPPEGEKAGMLSYSVRLDGNYRLLALDTCKYTADAAGKEFDGAYTDGQISDSLMEWALEEIADAKANGETVIGMGHHSLVKHFENHVTIFKAFVLDEWEECADKLADAGMDFFFSGHLHELEAASYVSDNGNRIYDMDTPSLTGYPNMFREVLLDNTAADATMTFETFDVDCEKQIVSHGTTYEKPFKNTYSFKKTFGGDLESFAMNFVYDYVGGFCNSVNANGGIIEALRNDYGLDVESLLDELIKGGVTLGCIDIFTITNIMSFVNDLCDQIEEKYIKNPQVLFDICSNFIESALSIKVSNLPCTNYIDTLGFGDTSKPGTLGDAAYSVLAHFYEGDQSYESDAFLQDAVKFFKEGNGANTLFDFLYENLLNGLLRDNILGGLQFNIDELFPRGTLGHLPASFLDLIFGLIFKGDKSYKNIANSILSLGLIGDFDSLNGIVDHYIEEYLTQSQLDSIGYTIGSILEDLASDNGEFSDMSATVCADSNCTVEATSANFREPTMVAVTLGEDASTSRSISWYTKYSVTGSDIEIKPYSASPSFTGTATTGNGIESTSVSTVRQFPAVDFGIAGFMPVKLNLVRHTVSLTNLKPGTKYSYRVGDAEKGWWSEAGVIETADNSDKTTFLHVTDSQSQNALQYERFHTVIGKAYELYPDTDFVISSGDQVDSGTNVNQWRWLLDGSSDILMKTSFMPATGNHEKSGAALDENFVLPNVPEQDTDSGVYYSYDYNNVHVMVLNTNALNSEKGLSDEQISWLKDSANSSDAQWKFVVIHKAVYSNGSHYDDKDVEAMRAQFKRLMPEIGIDMVFEGHDHVYLRTGAMYNNRVIKTKVTETAQFSGNSYELRKNPYGTYYVISGCSGVKNYVAKDVSDTDKLFPRAEMIYSTELSMFSAVRIDGNKLYFDAYTVDESGKTARIDSLAVAKDASKADSGPLVNGNDMSSVVPGEVVISDAKDKANELAAAQDLIDGLDVGVEQPEQPTTASGEASTVTSVTGSVVLTDDFTMSRDQTDADGNVIATESTESAVTSAASDDAVGTTIIENGALYGSAGTAITSTPDGESEDMDVMINEKAAADGEDIADNGTIMTFAAGAIPVLGGSAGKIAATIAIFGISALGAFVGKVRKKDGED